MRIVLLIGGQAEAQFCFTSSYRVSVFIDEDGIIHDASLNQTNIGNNNNKVCI